MTWICMITAGGAVRPTPDGGEEEPCSWSPPAGQLLDRKAVLHADNGWSHNQLQTVRLSMHPII